MIRAPGSEFPMQIHSGFLNTTNWSIAIQHGMVSRSKGQFTLNVKRKTILVLSMQILGNVLGK